MALAGTLAVLAIALALLLPAPAGGPPSAQPSAAPASTSPSSQSTPPSLPGSTTPSVTGEAPQRQDTDTPEAGQTPVEPPVTLPSVPAPPVPEAPVPEPSAGPPAPEEPGPAPQPAPFPESLRGQDVTVIPGAGRVVALTFDAGANAAGLPRILSTLSAKGVTGTFFLTGNWAVNNPQGVAQIAAAGHRVANHSMTHPGFTARLAMWR
jgi:peptidoglycan-N-acetylglucosamine deacetylase